MLVPDEQNKGKSFYPFPSVQLSRTFQSMYIGRSSGYRRQTLSWKNCCRRLQIWILFCCQTCSPWPQHFHLLPRLCYTRFQSCLKDISSKRVPRFNVFEPPRNSPIVKAPRRFSRKIKMNNNERKRLITLINVEFLPTFDQKKTLFSFCEA